MQVWNLETGTVHKVVSCFPAGSLIQNLIVNNSQSHFAVLSTSANTVILFKANTFDFVEINPLKVDANFGSIVNINLSNENLIIWAEKRYMISGLDVDLIKKIRSENLEFSDLLISAVYKLYEEIGGKNSQKKVESQNENSEIIIFTKAYVRDRQTEIRKAAFEIVVFHENQALPAFSCFNAVEVNLQRTVLITCESADGNSISFSSSRQKTEQLQRLAGVFE